MVVNRQHPILSPLAFLSAVLLVAGVGASVLLSGGSAFSPGPLTDGQNQAGGAGGFASHAEFEHDCRQCHAPLAGIEAARAQTVKLSPQPQVRAALGLLKKNPLPFRPPENSRVELHR